MKEIVVAGGCFWGVQEYYRRLKGVVETRAGYAQGITENPTYDEVKHQRSGHAECVWIRYDDQVLTLDMILDHLFRIIDPTSLNRQGNDIGTSYRTGIYPVSEAEETVARQFVQTRQKNYSRPIVTEVRLLERFYDAEEFHQDYLVKHPHGYCHVDFSKIRPEEMK